MLAQYALDVLPLQAVNRHGVVRHQSIQISMLGQQGCQYVVSIRRFAQVVARAPLDRFNGSGNARIPRQDHHPHFRVKLQQLGQQHQPRITVHFQIQRSKIRQILLGQL